VTDKPPAPNQAKDEPIAASPSESPQSSDDTGDVDDVRVNPPAPPGKPDGEVDTRA